MTVSEYLTRVIEHAVLVNLTFEDIEENDFKLRVVRQTDSYRVP